VALAPALRRLPALEELGLGRNPLGDEGLAALVAPPPPAGASPPPTGGLAKLKALSLSDTQIADAGCAALAAALDSGALPTLEVLYLFGTRASAAAKATQCWRGLAWRCCSDVRARGEARQGRLTALLFVVTRRTRPHARVAAICANSVAAIASFGWGRS
jgi:hypothetical protein